MTKAQAKRMGFKPMADALWKGSGYAGCWHRDLQRPACSEYWHPDQPQVIRREWYSSAYQTSPSHQTRQT